MKVERIGPLDIKHVDAWLVRSEDGRYWRVSRLEVNEDGKPETLVFSSTPEGHWTEERGRDYAGGEGATIDEAIEDLERVLDGEPRMFARPSVLGRVIDMLESGGHPSLEMLLETIKHVVNHLLGPMSMRESPYQEQLKRIVLQGQEVCEILDRVGPLSSIDEEKVIGFLAVLQEFENERL